MENINSFASLKSICSKSSASFLLSFIILLLFLLLLSVRCNHSTPPNNDNSSVTITAEDASCIEAWLNVKLSNITLPQQFNLFENDSLKTNLILLSTDTTILVEGLLPKKNYRYKLTYTNSGGEEKNSNEITVETLDTTSHNFTWQTFTFGQHSSSTLYDVAIIDENNIWAVGEIYMKDSLGNNDPHAYNAVHWDGSVWTVEKITVLFRGSFITPPLEGVFAFSSTDIWFVGSLPIHGDGTSWTMYDLRTTVDPSLSLSKAWGTNSNDMYFVGRNGNIAHWDGVNWSKIESGTTTNINDVWGTTDPITKENKIFCAVSFVWTMGDYKILTISDVNKVDSITWNTGRRVHTVWSKDGSKFYVGGGGVFTNRRKLWEEITELPLYYSRNIRGKNLNDIFVVGDFGWRAHFNGLTWMVYEQLPTEPDLLYSQQLTSNMLITVGERGNKAMLVVGKR